MSRVRRDHPHCRNAMWICMCGHTPDVPGVPQFRGLGAPGVEICLFPLLWLLAFTTDCTTVQAVIMSEPTSIIFDILLQQCFVSVNHVRWQRIRLERWNQSHRMTGLLPSCRSMPLVNRITKYIYCLVTDAQLNEQLARVVTRTRQSINACQNSHSLRRDRSSNDLISTLRRHNRPYM